MLRSDYDSVDRRHAAGLHTRGDRVDRPLHRLCHGRHARLALAQEHEARARDARADGLRPRAHPRSSSTARTAASASPTSDVGASSGGTRTCSSRATGRSPARSTKECRSSLSQPAVGRRRGVPRSSQTLYRQRRDDAAGRRQPAPRGADCFGRKAVDGASRASHARAADRSRCQGREPFAELKNRVHLRGDRRARPAALQRRDRPGRAARARRSRTSGATSPGGRASRATTASGSRTRSPTTSSATARSSGCSPTTRSPRSWSTARTRSGSSVRAGCTRRPSGSTTTLTCAGSSTRSSRRSAAASTSPRRWSTRACPTAAAST